MGARGAATGRAVALGGALAVVVFGACSAPREGAPSAVLAADLGDAAYRCGDVLVDPAVLDGGLTAADLDEAGREALEGTDVPRLADPVSWIVVEQTEERLALLRELPEPEDFGEGDVRTHESLVVAWVDAPHLDPSPQWTYASAGVCDLVRNLDPLGNAWVMLDPVNPPDPQSSELHLLVTELACNSGENAAGRVELVTIGETGGTVELVIGVAPRGGYQLCPGHPPTPFVLELGEPLGDRDLVNAGVYPPRELSMP